MVQCRITVLKKSFQDKASKQEDVVPQRLCPVFLEGQIFDSIREQPEGFCAWAWSNISKYVNVLKAENDTSESFIVENNSIVASCADSTSPVFFKIERINA